MKKNCKKMLSLVLVFMMLVSTVFASQTAYASSDNDSNTGDKRQYKVCHVLQNLDGSYTDPVEVETLEGNIGEKTQAQAKEYEGFTAQKTIGNQKIGKTGDIVITIKYSRNPYYITWIDGYSETDYISKFQYGDTIAFPKDPYIEGREFVGWYDLDGNEITTETMPAEDMTIVAKYNPNLEANYKVEYYVQNATDDVNATDEEKTYSLVKTVSDSIADVGSSWSDLSSNFDSYSVNSMKFVYNESLSNSANENVVVKGDNSTVFKVYIDRPIITIDMQYWKDGLKANAVSVGEAKGLYGASTSDVVWPTYTHEEGEPESWDGDYYWMIVANSGSIAFSGDAPTTFAQSTAYIKQNDDGTNVVTIASYASYDKYYNSAGIGGNTDPKSQYAHIEGLEDNTWIEALTVSKKLGNYTTSIIITNGSLEGFTTAAGQWGDFTANINDANVDFTKYWNLYGNSITLDWVDSKGTPVDSSSSGLKYITHDAHIYYTRNSYTLTFGNSGEGENSQVLVKYQAPLKDVKPEDPEVPSNMDSEYIFAGWYYDANYEQPVDWENDTMPARDLSIVAKWVLPEKIVTLKDGDETVGTVTTTKYDTIYKELDKNYELEKDGYTFTGWYKDEELTEPFLYNEQITSNMNLYAGWASDDEQIYNYTVTYKDTDGNKIAKSQRGKAVKGTVLYFDALSIDGYALSDGIDSQNITMSKNNMEITFTYRELGVITINPVSITAYVGGTSASGTTAPKMRYSVTTPDDVNLSSLTFTMHEPLEDGTTLTQTMSRERIDENDESTYCLFPLLEEGADYSTHLGIMSTYKSTFLEAIEISDNSDMYAGVYEIEYSEDFNDWYITAEDTDGNTYYVDFETRDVNGNPAQIIIRYVSDEDYENCENPTNVINPIVYSEDEVDTSNGAIALVEEGTTFTTNGDEKLGLFGASDKEYKYVDEEGAQVSLLFDERVEIDGLTTEAVTKYTEDSGYSLDGWETQYKYLDLVNENDGNAWVKSSQNVSIYWPYPNEEVAANPENYTFRILHYEGLNREYMNGYDFDDVNLEELEVKTTDKGIVFETDSFSPFLLLWQANAASEDENAANTTDNENNDNTYNTITKETTNKDAETPKTGDSTSITLLAVLMGEALLLFVLILIFSRKRKHQ